MLPARPVEYMVDAVTMIGHWAIADAYDGRRPGVLLLHLGGGLDDNMRSRAKRLAALAYTAFALDYFGGGRQLPFDQAQARLIAFLADVDATRRLARVGLAELTSRKEVDGDRLAAVGSCFGGTALELARDGAPVQAVVGFHPGLTSARPDDSANITASVLMCCGADDPVITVEARNAFEHEMRVAGVRDWRLEVYGGVGHSFTNPTIDARGFGGFTYDERADRRSWKSMLDVLQESVGSA